MFEHVAAPLRRLLAGSSVPALRELAAEVERRRPWPCVGDRVRLRGSYRPTALGVVERAEPGAGQAVVRWDSGVVGTWPIADLEEVY